MNIVFISGIAIVLVWAGMSYVYLRRVRKHDRVLFAFNHLRRTVMRELFAHYDALSPNCRGTLSPEEIAAAKFLRQHLDTVLLHYDRHKTTMFNLRKMRRMIEQDLAHYRKVEREVLARLHSVPVPGKIADLYAEFAQAGAAAFVAYTPFIHAEIILRLLWADLAEQIAPIRSKAAHNLFGEKFA